MTLRVAIVVQRGRGAGAVISPLHLARGLAACGLHVQFVCEPGSDVEPLAREAGLEVHAVSLEPKANRENARRLVEHLSRHPVDVVNSQTRRDRTALSLARLLGQLAPPLVITWRGMPSTFPLKNWLAERTVAVSRAVGEALVRRGTPRRRLAVIPNGVALERLDQPVSDELVAEWRSRIGWDPSRRTLGIVARPKDQAVVLDALSRVRTPIRLVLAGVDPSGELGRRAAAVAGPHVVVCLPFDHQVRPLYELLDLVLLPARFEGTSQALLEAMALGKPILASRAGGIPDTLEDGVTGRLLPPLEPGAWADAIEQALARPEMMAGMAARARRVAREEYSLDRTIARTRALYEEVLAARR